MIFEGSEDLHLYMQKYEIKSQWTDHNGKDIKWLYFRLMETIHIVGAGPAGLMAAQQFASLGHAVIVYDHKLAAGRKFLVAGNGGFNLSHSEPINDFLDRYDTERIKEIVRGFDNQNTVTWLKSIGIPTYVGSSGKIFPKKGMKPIEVLQQWLRCLAKLNVEFKFGYYLVDFTQNALFFSTQDRQKEEVPYDRAVFALGGMSWSKTGSDGKWIQLFETKEIEVSLTGPSNSGIELVKAYPHLAGHPLKNIKLFNNSVDKVGEMVFTQYGIEGSAVYYLNRFIRQQAFPQTLYVDLKPSFDETRIKSFFDGGKIVDVLKQKLKLDPTKLNLLKTLDKEVYVHPEKLAHAIKNFPLELKGFRPIEEVISTYGGIAWQELSPNLSLKKYPRIQCCGEMLDWDAPTGGYLLQGCFATGYYVVKG